MPSSVKKAIAIIFRIFLSAFFGIWIIGGIGTLPTYPVFSVIFIALNGWFIYLTWNWHPKRHKKHDASIPIEDVSGDNTIDEIFEAESKGSTSAASTFSNDADTSLDFQPFTKEAKVQTDQKASCHNAFRNDLERIPKHKIVINRQNNIIRHSLCPEHTFSNVTKQTNMEHLGSFTAIDTETTGLHPSSDRITEVTAIRFRNWEPVEIFSTLVNPGRKIPAVVTAKTGIDNSMVQNQPAFAEIADDLASFIGSDNIVGHNLSFDMQFLECSGMDLSLPKKRKFYDTLKLARYTLVKYGQKVWDPDEGGYTESDEWDVMDYKLTTLCDYYGIRDNSSAHRAASDAYATGILFHMLAESKVSK